MKASQQYNLEARVFGLNLFYLFHTQVAAIYEGGVRPQASCASTPTSTRTRTPTRTQTWKHGYKPARYGLGQLGLAGPLLVQLGLSLMAHCFLWAPSTCNWPSVCSNCLHVISMLHISSLHVLVISSINTCVINKPKHT